MEFLVGPGCVDVHSSSRLGTLDFGVNAMRINWFARELEKIQGWKTSRIEREGHEEYFSMHGINTRGN